MLALHANWFYVAVGTTGVAGVWGLVLAIRKQPPNRAFTTARSIAVVAMLVQVGLGLVMYGQGHRPDDAFHVFYGVVIAVTLAIVYVYRSAMARRPALAWGLLLLFVMGLGLRAWANV
jgi:hypothetical protein